MLAQIFRRAISGTGRRNPNSPNSLLRSIISPIFIPKPTPTQIQDGCRYQPPPPTPLRWYIFRNSSKTPEAINIPPQTLTTPQTSPNPESQNPPPKTPEPEKSHSKTPEPENPPPKTPSQTLTPTTNPDGTQLPVHLMAEFLQLIFKKAREIEESDIWKVFILTSSFFGVLMTLWMLYKKFREEALGESKKQLIVKIDDKVDEQTIVFKRKIEEVKDDIKEVKGKVKKGFEDVKGGLKKVEEAISTLKIKNGVDDGEKKE